MSIKINFDLANNPEVPTFVLAKKNGDRIGVIPSKAISMSDVLNDFSEITFTVDKYVNNELCYLWNDIVNFKLLHCVEWDLWFEITVEINESTEITKTVYCKSLGQAELSQIKIHGTEINTETDISRDDYVVTVLYNPYDPSGSLLHRILEKAPHYSIAHVDSTIRGLIRIFTFDDISIYDALLEVAEEIGCIFIFDSNSDENGNIRRTISVYDLQSNCNECGYRGEFTNTCPKCGSELINEGYGEDTNIFVTADMLADKLKLSTETDSIKNCFKLVAGDDLMIAAIQSCNPNGTDYLWYIPENTKQDMSEELVTKLDEYDELSNCYQDETDFSEKINEETINSYNNLISTYRSFNDKLEYIFNDEFNGYAEMMNAYFNTIDLKLYLQTGLMPNASMAETTALLEIIKCTEENISPVSVSNISNVSLSSANNAVLAMAKVVIDNRYKVRIHESSFDEDEKIWTGNFEITNYSDNEDTAISNTIEVELDDDYETFVRQKIDKTIQKSDTSDLSITGLFEKDLDEFELELKKYSLDYLNIIHNCCQGCIDVLIEQGIANGSTWADEDPNLYEVIYVPYHDKLDAIETELDNREAEIGIITSLQTEIETIRNEIQEELNMESFLGEELWLEFSSFRREDTYSNTNYISDGLNNAELFTRANEFIEIAKIEIYKSATLQHKIESTLKNLLVIDRFKELVNHFQVGNWLRVEIDEEIYKLRLTKYTINFDNLNTIAVEFSDVINIKDTVRSVRDVIEQAQSIATSYDSVRRQASQGAQSNDVIKDWTNNGLDITNIRIIGGSGNQTQSWDSHGMLFREYDEIEESYSQEQIKIINSTIAMTDDNWNSAKSAFGKFNYYDPISKEIKVGFGINGELLIGKLILGESLGICNENNSMTFDKNGLKVSNNRHSVVVNPSDEDSIFSIKDKDNGDIFSFDKDTGDLTIVGSITAKSLTLLDGAEIPYNKVNGLHEVAITGDFEKLINIPNFATVATSGEYDDLLNKPHLHGVAISGNYADLINRPNIQQIESNIADILEQLEALNEEVFGT